MCACMDMDGSFGFSFFFIFRFGQVLPGFATPYSVGFAETVMVGAGYLGEDSQ